MMRLALVAAIAFFLAGSGVSSASGFGITPEQFARNVNSKISPAKGTPAFFQLGSCARNGCHWQAYGGHVAGEFLTSGPAVVIKGMTFKIRPTEKMHSVLKTMISITIYTFTAISSVDEARREAVSDIVRSIISGGGIVRRQVGGLTWTVENIPGEGITVRID